MVLTIILGIKSVRKILTLNDICIPQSLASNSVMGSKGKGSLV